MIPTKVMRVVWGSSGYLMMTKSLSSIRIMLGISGGGSKLSSGRDQKIPVPVPPVVPDPAVLLVVPDPAVLLIPVPLPGPVLLQVRGVPLQVPVHQVPPDPAHHPVVEAHHPVLKVLILPVPVHGPVPVLQNLPVQNPVVRVQKVVLLQAQHPAVPALNLPVQKVPLVLVLFPLLSMVLHTYTPYRSI